MSFIVAGAHRGNAQVTTYSGHDAGAGLPAANSLAAQTAFLTATGGLVGITFETALPPGILISAGTITDNSGCAAAFCGANTTPAGSFFLKLFGGSATFTFGSPIHYFGAYFGGVQVPNALTFDNGSAQSVNIPFTDLRTGGYSFAGFESATGFSSLTVITGNDVLTVDDVIYGATVTATPEPGTLTLLATGFAALVGWRHRRRSGSSAQA